ncbi:MULTISPECIES: TonB-dependent receptor domain-containing protein [unclassified Sphingomonas]|uniref:TonB-dependent receptor domain-containing protein n=1 Tax=unclassified Sphingomonas TaxID=196159 RepID=UPI00070115EE|nr:MULTISPECIES: TonB-dependent receptor [unclassified Sphingomonas]KQX25149.1 TonB-dependent receptor [Sphingomonas sp. Root1294]KQY66166.1 TonB-dependent receptor [Sphingomonas sp. Root50]KRB89669.1 TonB-dependent receptor [Sphingomonas sp. Root720]
MVSFAWSGAALASLALSSAHATPRRIDIGAGSLPSALADLSSQTGISVGLAGTIPPHPTPRIRGTMEPEKALRRLLKGSGLRAIRAGPAIWRLERPVANTPPTARPPVTATFDDIVVTGRKRDEWLSEVPVAISVVRPDMAGDMAARRGIHDLLAFAEGAFTTNLGPGRDRIFLRGVADSAFNGSTQSTVNLYLDDARVSYATPDPDLRLLDIDRIELLRGPQGALYGSGALGGIVRIVPKKPDLQNWSGMAAIEGAAIAHGGLGGVAEGATNAPIITDRLALRLAAYADQGGGWIDDRGRDRKDVNRSRRYGGRATVGWRFADGWHVDMGLTAQWLNVRDGQYAFRRLERSTALAEPHDNDFLAATATVRGKVGSLDLLSSTAYVTHEFSSVYDATSQAASRGLSAPLGFEELRVLRLGTQEMRLSDPVAHRPWVAGLTLLQAENTLRDSFLPAASPAMRIVSQHNDSLETALFGEITQPLGQDWSSTLGARAYLARVDNEQDGQARRRARRSGITPSLSLSWHPADRAIVWIRYSAAVRPGGINPEGDPRSRSFRSDDLKSIELGWRLTSDNGRFRLNGNLFGLRWENVQSDVLGMDSLVRTINAGNARNLGAELSGEVRLGAFRLETNLTVQHGRLNRPSAAANALGDDNRLPVLPDYAGGLKLSYVRPVGDVPFRGFLSVRYTGSARLSFDPSLGHPTGDFWVSDIGAEVTDGDWKAGITITNLLDQRENSFGFGNPFTLRSIDQRTPLQPRTLTVRVQKNF